jgi:hypothetical protein
MFQKQIYSNLAAGVEGEYADDSPRRETPYILLSNTTQKAAAAKGSLAFTDNPADGDTVTIGSVVYRFKTDMAQANDIKIGSVVANTITSLEKTINGEGEEGTDYYAGTTTPLTDVIASVSRTTLNLTALVEGTEGNSIALASSDENITATAFSGGVDVVTNSPRFACAFTYGLQDGTAMLGGEGVFAGVLVNPKMYANYMNLEPTLNLPDGSQGGLCTFGHINIKPASAFSVGNIAAYDKATGKINAYVNTEAVPESSVVIPNAQFIKHSGNAGDIAVLELGN